MSRSYPSHAIGAALAWAALSVSAAPAAQTAGADAAGGSIPTFSVVSASEPVAVKTEISKQLQPFPAFEAAPVVVKTASGPFLLATTGWSWWCRLKDNILQGPVHLEPNNCKLFSFPARIDPHRRNDPQTGMNVTADELKLSADDWRLNYSGAMSAVSLETPWDGYDVVVAVHGEDKNERVGDTLYANTVNTDVSPATCAEGAVNGAYKSCWESYNAFISLIFLNSKTGRKLDVGPVLWPSAGYIAEGKKASGGVRHPSLFATDKYLYVYYLDTSHGGEAGRRNGIRVARFERGSSLTNAPEALSYFAGRFSDDNPTLPSGFGKRHIRDFYDKLGGRSNVLWTGGGQDDRFSVTRIRKTPYFLGVEEYGSGEGWGLRLRISADLTHWSDPVAIPGMTASSWANGALHYPVFSNASGDDSQSVDPNDFFLVGSASQTGVVRQHLSLRISDSPQP